MMRLVVAVAVFTVVDAHLAVNIQGNLRAGNTARMQPEVVAHTLVRMENEWKGEALAFNECNSTASAGDDDAMSACIRAPSAFHASCMTVASAVVEASSGDKQTVTEYMEDICGQAELKGWRQSKCQGFSLAILSSMTADSVQNRDDFNADAVCKKLWAEAVESEKAAALENSAEDAATRVEETKRAEATNDNKSIIEQTEERVSSNTSAEVRTNNRSLMQKSKLDINQKVYIENAAVLGDGAGDGALNVCRAFTEAHVSNPDAPVVKVCGTGIKATVFLRGRCEAYYEHSVTVGKCDSGAPSSTCDTYSPADKSAFGHYQSYKIEQC